MFDVSVVGKCVGVSRFFDFMETIGRRDAAADYGAVPIEFVVHLKDTFAVNVKKYVDVISRLAHDDVV